MRMRLLPLLLALAASSVAAACASGPSLPPKAGPEEVELINPNQGQTPREGYETIGPVRAVAPEGTPMAELMMLLRSEAAEMGADAVLFQQVRQSTAGAAADADRGQELIAEGLAIYWPMPGG